MKKYAALLLSRQSLRPSGKDSWVENLATAIKWLNNEQLGLISSVGMPTWDIVTALASRAKIPLKLILLASDNQEFEKLIVKATYDFELDASLTEFVPCWRSTDQPSVNSDYQKRDAMIVRSAELLLPISIRPHGIINRLLAEAEANGKKIKRQFETKYRKRKEPIAYTIDKKNIRPELGSAFDDCLIHWTRASSSAWPGEKMIDYYCASAGSTNYPRSAFDTLKRIIQTRTIIASSRHMPENMKTVSFSEAKPQEIIDLIKWRARYRMMSFEPYGIGIKHEVAHKLGVRPVVYYDKSEKLTDNDDRMSELWLTQSQGVVTDWRNEKEHRCLGDFDLGALPVEKLILFCHTADEAALLTEQFKIRAISFLP